MIINAENVELVYRELKSVYTEAYLQAPSHSEKVVMKVPSSAREETYGWMGRLPQMREWIGPRHVKGPEAYGFTIHNRRFESTVGVPRTDIADDRLAMFKPVFSETGQHARRHPEQLAFGTAQNPASKPKAMTGSPSSIAITR